MEDSIESRTLREAVIDAVEDLINKKDAPNRSKSHSFTLHIQGVAEIPLRTEATKLLVQQGYGYVEFREESLADGRTLTYLDSRQVAGWRSLRKPVLAIPPQKINQSVA